jgi:hypothetical protein
MNPATAIAAAPILPQTLPEIRCSMTGRVAPGEERLEAGHPYIQLARKDLASQLLIEITEIEWPR